MLLFCVQKKPNIVEYEYGDIILKTMKRADQVIRVEENQVSRLLGQGYTFCPKHVWKETVRDAEPEEPKKRKSKKKSKKSVE